MWDKSLDLVDSFTGWTPKEFVDIFYLNYQYIPSYAAVSCFGAAEVIMGAIEKSQSLDPITLADTLRASEFQTIYANVKFDANNQIEAHDYRAADV
jgi:ABC-type branched-subunit amino acid transport system substrate-binding protein